MKLRHILTTVITTLILSTTVLAGNDISVTLDGARLEFEQAPKIVNGSTLLPIRGLFDKMGYSIAWFADTKTATLTNDTTIIYATPGSLTAKDRATMRVYTIESQVQPQIIDGYFMVPLRSVAEATNADVDWDANTRTVIISRASASTEKPSLPEGKMTVKEDEYLTQTFELVKKLKDDAVATKDEPMLRFWGAGYINEDVVNAKTKNYNSNIAILKDLKAMTPPDSMKNIDEWVEAFTATVEQAYDICSTSANGSITPEELTKTIDTLKENKDNIAIEHSFELYKYFNDNDVYFEKVYGENTLDILK